MKAEEEAKKAKKRAKKDKLKEAGLWMTKAEKRKKDEAEMRRKELIESGVIKVENEEEDQNI